MNKLFLLDIDNTLLIPSDIFIYYNYNNKKIKYTPEEYNALNIPQNEKYKYDYSDFRNPKKIRNSIINSIPLYKNLKIVNKYINNGWKIGILTARGEQDIIRIIIKKWLEKYLQRKDINFMEEEIYAVNDQKYNYNGGSDPERKLIVVKKLLNKYDKICFIDDNIYTIKIFENFNKKSKKKIELILAK